MYNFDPKKFVIKNIVCTILILLVAIISTYKIYYKFQDDRDVNYNSSSFVVTFHEKTGDKISLNKVTPVSDSVGLSSKTYNLNIKNNLTEDVDFKIKVIDDLETIKMDKCNDILIPKSDIRISVKNGKKDNQIYTLSDLNDGILLNSKINALEDREIAIRVWINKDSTLPMGSNMHYHGIIQVLEQDNTVAIR